MTTLLLDPAAEELAASLRAILVSVRGDAGGGSGTVWSEDGLVITNSHVVPGETATVTLPGGQSFEGTLTARDPDRDLAALRIPTGGLAAATPAASVRPGQLAFAIGNPWGQPGVLTAGVVLGSGPAVLDSGLELEDAIRAEVRLGPGNSGGPLADAHGRVIGINSMIAGGMAIAVPAPIVERFVAGDVPGAAFLGIVARPALVRAAAAAGQITPHEGLLVTGVEAGSPAERAGMLPGDIVLALGEAVGVRAASRALRRLRPGAPVALSLLRGGRLVEAYAEPAARN
ncbi:MAG: trypsin-like peptidase domain-containing protein [Dehalococcoidia bacterium]